MLYLMFVPLAGWVAPLARSSASKDAELLVLRQARHAYILGVTANPDGGWTV